MRISREPLGLAALLVVSASTQAQDLAYDQVCGPDTLQVVGVPVVGNRLAQSFTPELPGIGFVQFQAGIYPEGGSSLSRVTLRETGLNGPVVASTETLVIGENAVGVRTYLFPGNVAIMPGQTYWLEFELLSIDAPSVNLSLQFLEPSSYEGGDLYSNGFLNAGLDFWFREGLVVPEPGSGWLLMAGALAVATMDRRRSAPGQGETPFPSM